MRQSAASMAVAALGDERAIERAVDAARRAVAALGGGVAQLGDVELVRAEAEPAREAELDERHVVGVEPIALERARGARAKPALAT